MVYRDENITIEKFENEIIFTNHKNGGEVTKGVVNKEKNEVTIYLPNGAIDVAKLDLDGNIYINNELVIEKVDNNHQISTRFVPSGYVYFNTWRTTQNTKKTMAGISISLLGLIPGLGIASTIAGIVVGFSALQDDTYIEIKQYYQNITYLIYDVAKFYKNSDYTGLLKTAEHGPYKAF